MPPSARTVAPCARGGAGRRRRAPPTRRPWRATPRWRPAPGRGGTRWPADAWPSPAAALTGRSRTRTVWARARARRARMHITGLAARECSATWPSPPA
eukprot:scaffold44186_cov27-Phaeocystis_antarctica.AAC.1